MSDLTTVGMSLAASWVAVQQTANKHGLAGKQRDTLGYGAKNHQCNSAKELKPSVQTLIHCN